ncbi:hypothetical protein ACDQ55_07420 [Chitinophaga sp. 30R24]|uniref:hypothetical protein n=1 Tax=Chitinophaga sp. 30R24 TaxID=3248838 RepID=UPI003B8F9A8B
MLKRLLPCVPVLFSLQVTAQQAKLVRITGCYDTTAVSELYNKVPVGIQLFYSDSSMQQTTGWLHGSYRWHKLKVNSSNGNIQDGILYFNRAQLIKDNYRITLTVNNEDSVPLQTTLHMPYVTGIRFNHYADSVKRDIRFYLNVEGKFSSGKILPLDTATIRFVASDGKIIGQDLLLPANDTSKTVTVEAWYKYGKQFYLHSVLPVKQAPDNDPPITNNIQEPNNKKQKRP